MYSVEVNFLYFPPWDSLRLLVCYRAHFSVPDTIESNCVAICLRLTTNFGYNDWTTMTSGSAGVTTVINEIQNADT